MNKKQVMGEAFRFAIVGGVATLLHLGIYWGLLWTIRYVNNTDIVSPLAASLAYTAGYVLSFIANFYLTSYFTFKSQPSWRKLLGMGGAHAVNYLLHIGLLNLFMWVGIPETWCPFPVFAIAIPVNFLLVRFVFKKNSKIKTK